MYIILVLTLISCFGGAAGLLGAIYSNAILLRIGTIIASLFCLRHIDFVMTFSHRISLKILIAGLSFLIGKLIGYVFDLTIPYLGWIIADILFVFTAMFTVIDIIHEIMEARR